MHFGNLVSSAQYLVDCALTFRSSRTNRLARAPMPSFTIVRNGAVATETPPGSSLDDVSFHFITGFSAVDGDNVVRVQVRAASGIIDWRAEWNACDLEPLR
jgi:hypothetical protein